MLGGSYDKILHEVIESYKKAKTIGDAVPAGMDLFVLIIIHRGPCATAQTRMRNENVKMDLYFCKAIYRNILKLL